MTRAAENRKLLVKLTVIAVGMFGFGFALVPFYKANSSFFIVSSLPPLCSNPSYFSLSYSSLAHPLLMYYIIQV